MQSLIRCFSKFSTGKYFKDQTYQNITAIAYDSPGALSNLCQILYKNGINLTYLRTHCENHHKGQKSKYRLELSIQADQGYNFGKAKIELQNLGFMLTQTEAIQVPWFPRNFEDINLIGHDLQQVNESKEHPQFQDLEYKARRDYIASVASNFKMREPIPDIEYTQGETDLWARIYKQLRTLHKGAMCERFMVQSQNLNKELRIQKRIPQLSQLSEYLKSKTGFQIKPTYGILGQREFLNAFAFKIFCSTQYIRNVKNPDYTPEPDYVHQILGHVPQFADPEVAELSQTIGLLSLGATDEEISKLGALYWFTIEFGVCRQNNQNRGYGAGIASSIGQINWMLGKEKEKPIFQMLDIAKDGYTPFPVQTVQPIYKVAESFQDALLQLKKYGRQIMKPITTVWNEQTESIQYDRNIEAIWTEDKGPKF